MVRWSWLDKFLFTKRDNARPFLRFGGQKELPKRSDLTSTPDPLAPLLAALSWKYGTNDAKLEPFMLPESGSTKMKEYLAHWVGRVWIHQNKLPTGARLNSFDIFGLESEFRDYIAKHGTDLFDYGMTVEEILLSQQLHDATPYTLLLAKRYEDYATSRITDKFTLESEVLVWLLAGLCINLGIDRPLLSVMTTNGEIGHCIQIGGLNGIDFIHPRGNTHIPCGWFSFHDPWPARSLLASKQDFTEIDIFEDVSRPPLWLISPADLEKVIVGFIFPKSLSTELNDLLLAVGKLEKNRRNAEIPLWIECPEKPDQLFPLLLAMHGGKTPTTFLNLVGLAQLNFIVEDVGSAQSLLLGAYAIKPTSETKELFVTILTNFGHSELAKKWLNSL